MKWFAKRLLGKAMWVLACVMVLVLVEGHAAGQCNEQKLLASDGTPRDLFGASVAISGHPGREVAIVGAIFDTPSGLHSGSAYIYRKRGINWFQETKLIASDNAAFDRFGNSLSISGNVAIVGARFDDDRGSASGSAYIFRFNGTFWVEEAKLIASDGISQDRFGTSVSISGTPRNEVAIVGASGVDDNGSSSGASYIFRFNPETSEWIEEEKLIASDGAEFDKFGFSVSIRSIAGNEVAIIGAYLDDDNVNGTSSGSAYIFRYDTGLPGWTEEAKLIASDGAEYDEFGRSVSISGDPEKEVAIVGANFDDDNGSNSGSAYIYRKSGANWVEEAKLLASNGETNNWFGLSVSISSTLENDIAIVGAQSAGKISIGAAYLYRFNPVTLGWIEETKLLASDGTSADFFGFSVSISSTPGNEVAIVGAPFDDDSAISSGSAYIYELPCSPDCSADLNDDGFVNVSDLLLLLGVRNPCPPPGSPPCPPGSQGDRPVNVTDLLALLAAWGPCP